MADPALIWIRLNIVRATLRVPRTAPRLSRVVRDAKRVPNQRLHRTVAAQPSVAPRLPVSRGAVGRHEIALTHVGIEAEELGGAMFKSWFVIILVFVGGVTGILGWLVDFAPYYAFASKARSAEATPAYKTQKPGSTASYLGETRYQFPLRFRTESGQEVVAGGYYTNTYVPRRALDALERNGRVTVFYLPDDPERVLFEGDIQKLPRGYGSLVWGLACLAVGVALVPRRYQLARYTKYLGRGESQGDG